MRIIRGKYKKKHIYQPKNFEARPTTDIAKEGLFNIIENNFDIENISVLDIFSGTGSISYEFASRNCNNIISVEINYINYSFICKNVKELDFSQIKTYKTDAFKYLKKCNTSFDIIFADPPYNLKNIEDIPLLVFENKLLKKIDHNHLIIT